jgi:hypothetical protein
VATNFQKAFNVLSMPLEEAMMEIMGCVEPMFERLSSRAQLSIQNSTWDETDMVFEDLHSLQAFCLGHFQSFFSTYNPEIVIHLFSSQYLLRAIIELQQLPFPVLTGSFSKEFILRHYFTQLQNHGRPLPIESEADLSILKDFLGHSGLAK